MCVCVCCVQVLCELDGLHVCTRARLAEFLACVHASLHGLRAGTRARLEGLHVQPHCECTRQVGVI